MSTFFEQSFGEASEGTKVIASVVMDMTDDENGNSVMFEDHRAFVQQVATVEQDGITRTTVKNSVGMTVHEIDELIAALEAAKKEIYYKRMDIATAHFLKEKEAQEKADAIAHEAAIQAVVDMF